MVNKQLNNLFGIFCFAGGFGIPRADVFIPEPLEGKREEKKEYTQFIDRILIPELKSRNIRFVHVC